MTAPQQIAAVLLPYVTRFALTVAGFTVLAFGAGVFRGVM